MYDCRYCLFFLPEDLENYSWGIIGPWLESPLEYAAIDAIIQRGKVPSRFRPELAQYIERVPQIHSIHSWEAMLCAHISSIYRSYGDKTPIGIFHYRSTLDFPIEAYSPEADVTLTMKVIEEHYHNENALLKAVSKGDADESFRCMAKFGGYPSNGWTINKVRESKNYLFILDTLLRKTVENSHVHPAHINSVSIGFFRRIEQVTHYQELVRLVEAMIRQYCALVKKFSLRGYSPLIRNVINTIDFNLQEPLSLAILAKEFSVNPSNLSVQFRREKGIPISEYINKKRMEKAELLLNNSGAYIQDIAEQCGFLDTNYFARLFKRHFGISPGDFRKRNSIVNNM
jgi:AraC-like DNA-binding protein